MGGKTHQEEGTKRRRGWKGGRASFSPASSNLPLWSRERKWGQKKGGGDIYYEKANNTSGTMREKKIDFKGRIDPRAKEGKLIIKKVSFVKII